MSKQKSTRVVAVVITSMIVMFIGLMSIVVLPYTQIVRAEAALEGKRYIGIEVIESRREYGEQIFTIMQYLVVDTQENEIVSEYSIDGLYNEEAELVSEDVHNASQFATATEILHYFRELFQMEHDTLMFSLNRKQKGDPDIYEYQKGNTAQVIYIRDGVLTCFGVTEKDDSHGSYHTAYVNIATSDNLDDLHKFNQNNKVKPVNTEPIPQVVP